MTEKNEQNEKKKEYLTSAAFQAILESTKDMVFVKDIDLVYAAVSMPFVRMVGKESQEEIIGHTDYEIFEDKILAGRYVTDDHKLLESGQDLVDYIEPIADDHGKARYGSTSKHILRDMEGTCIGILGVTKDITRDYLARQHFQRELKYLFELPEDAYAVTYIDIDNWRIISQRRQLIEEGTLQACLSVERLCEAALESIVDQESAVAAFYRGFTTDTLRTIYASGRTNLSFTYQRYLSNGKIRWIRNDVRLMIDMDSGHLCAMLSARDVDDMKREEQELAFAARMDKMTMLLNRETTMARIRDILEKEPDKMHALFMMDVDNFKNLNDTLGHQAGDEFLTALALQMKSGFRESDVVGRIGGDEFFMLMRNVPGREAAVKKAELLMEAVRSICADYPDIAVSGSIGISLYPEMGTTLEELYKKADEALYEAKRKGKNQVRFAGEE